MGIFELVKESVTARDVAEFYGLKVNRHGMACCPFHDDKHPSFKVDRYYYCFGCGAKGDAIDYVAKLFGLSLMDAALKICHDFGLGDPQDRYRERPYVRIRTKPKKSDEQIFKETEQHTFRVLSDYYHQLKKWEIEYAPKSPDEEWHPYFVEALREKTTVEYQLDTLLEGDIHDRAFLISDCGRKVKSIAERLQEFNKRRDEEGKGSLRDSSKKSKQFIR